MMDVLFVNEDGEHTKEGICKACWYDSGYAGDICKCGGKFHSEFEDEYCTEDYSDCWNTYTYRCDICGSENPWYDTID